MTKKEFKYLIVIFLLFILITQHLGFIICGGFFVCFVFFPLVVGCLFGYFSPSLLFQYVYVQVPEWFLIYHSSEASSSLFWLIL